MTTTTDDTEIVVQTKKPWHQTEKGCWSSSFEAADIVVRVQQRKPDGPFYRIVGSPEQWKSLATADRDEAETRATAFLRVLAQASAEDALAADASGEVAVVTNPLPATPSLAAASNDASLTLGRLWTLYQESDTFLTNAAHTQLGDRSRARILLAGLGEDTRVVDLCDDGITAFKRRRTKGGIVYRRPCSGSPTGWTECKTDPAGDRSVGADVRLLLTMLNWAFKKKKVNGRYLLNEMPLRGVTVPRESSPKRPVADWDRYRQTRWALVALADEAQTPEQRRLWILTEFALVLAEATGRRISAVLKLRWRDLDARAGSWIARAILWEKANDKKRKERYSPLSPELQTVIDEFRSRLGAAGASGDDLVFAVASNPTRPYTDDHLADKLVAAEQRAGLPKLDGGVWHPYRRKWATERKHWPASDVMAAGGWDDYNTYLACYSAPDPKTMTEVMAEPLKLRANGELNVPEETERLPDQPAVRRGGLRLVS